MTPTEVSVQPNLDTDAVLGRDLLDLPNVLRAALNKTKITNSSFH